MSKCLKPTGDNQTDVVPDDEMSLMWLGILLGAVGSLGIALGELGRGRLSDRILSVDEDIKQSGNASQEQKAKRDSLVRTRRVYSTVFVVCAIMNFVAFSFAPTTILAPLEGLQFVTSFGWAWAHKNRTLWIRAETDYDRRSYWTDRFFYTFGSLVISVVHVLSCQKHLYRAVVDDASADNLFLGKKRVGVASLGTFVVVGSILGVVMFTPTIDTEFGIDGLVCLWARPEFFTPTSVMACGAIGVYLWNRCTYAGKPTTALAIAIRAFPFSTAGAIGATFAKQISELLRVLIEDPGGEVWTNEYGLLYTIGAATGICFGVWFYNLDRAVVELDETMAIPIYQGIARTF